MKKLLVLGTAILMASVCGAQTLDEIINKNYSALGAEALGKAKTIYMEGRASQMGMEMQMVMQMKQPDKVRVVTTFNGMDIVVAYDGVKGYMVNPMTGATDPVELPQEQLGDVQRYNMFHNQVLEQFRAGKLKLLGEEDVNGQPAYKIEAAAEEGNPSYIFIDKGSSMIVKTVATVNQMGQDYEVETYTKEYMDVSGIKFPKVTTSFVNGMEAGGMTFDKVEIDREMDDSIFTLK
jgi:outer membrane lipoprotein-sorting protein